MKKLALTLAIVLGLSMTTFADGSHPHGGIFQRGATQEGYAMFNRDNENTPMLPTQHGLDDHQDADDSVPLGSGVAVLLGLGAAYLVGKKHNKE